ncbi:hypothetical protein FRACYDRAFT_265309 [Fragilariopsis cylindrus CCMP1102]|uniref:RNI-like protein n=1 Tax=Fragilariopsis cylindrus CCMP1102 TaxID=635003 RepID=A0A1E7ELZ0_9STRA|nr:hypothetical protein FRACYDRAFT_265309 [Fragilariopsis cylindrus CCMP1102]|eukprot:OEU06938.1 hypothetical protein FRACYDRAFT_265309 [Fragilariopsis cylindrus CCMP1102]
MTVTIVPVAPAPASSSDRDGSFRNLLNKIPDEIRRKLITLSLNSIPKEVAFTDGIIVIFILVKVGMVDLDNLANNRIGFNVDTDDRKKWTCGVDDDGRIIRLAIGKLFYGDLPAFDLPVIIQYLERLTDLTLVRCRSLPTKALTNLQHLKTLSLNQCGDLLDNFPAQMELLHLENLAVNDCRLSQASSFLTWMTTKLPWLKSLEFSFIRTKNEVAIIFGTLSASNAVCFQDTIKNLEFYAMHLNDQDLETLVLDILPSFPNISSLNLFANEIHSIKPILDRIKDDVTFSPSKSIRIMNLINNPITEKMKKYPMEKDAFLSFLRVFKTIHNLGSSGSCCCEHGCDDLYGSDIEFALRINHAGRSLVEFDEGDNNDKGRAVPLSLWPTLLERSYAKSGQDGIYQYCCEEQKLNENATGLYYLLRAGPALIGRPELGSGTVGYEVADNDASLSNDDKSKKKGKNSLKRKRP